MRSALLAVLTLALPFAGCTSAGGEATTWEFTDTDGNVHNETEAQGAPTLLFFMATWCSDCRRKAPMVAEVNQEFEGQGLTTYSISTDPDYDTDARLETWKTTLNQTWPHGRDQGGLMQETFDVRSQSTIVILAADGRPHETIAYGKGTRDSIRGAVEGAFSAS